MRTTLVLVLLLASTLLAGCGTLPDGRLWGQDATLVPGWDRVRDSAVGAARDPWVWGPLLGAAFFILARDLLGAYTETWLFWYGLLFMGVVLWKPEGLAGLLREFATQWRKVH